jgi:hypothetical protein
LYIFKKELNHAFAHNDECNGMATCHQIAFLSKFLPIPANGQTCLDAEVQLAE